MDLIIIVILTENTTNMKLVMFKNNFQILLQHIQMRSEQFEVSAKKSGWLSLGGRRGGKLRSPKKKKFMGNGLMSNTYTFHSLCRKTSSPSISNCFLFLFFKSRLRSTLHTTFQLSPPVSLISKYFPIPSTLLPST